jgi:hypothetical protein
MHEIYQSNNRKFSLNVTITCSGKKTFRVWAEDYGKKFSKYADRTIIVDGSRVIYLSFPVSPKQLFIGCLNATSPTDKDYKVTIEEKPLKDYNIALDSETLDFLSLCIPFCQMAGFKIPNPTGTVYKTSDDKFRIKYFPVIKDYATGNVIATPARIGHQTGIIEVAYSKFKNYTIPMRIDILLHEFSHKYKNPKIGLEISNEIGADINALYIYLGLGFSKIDAICVFGNVFLKAQSSGNQERMRKIIDYINKFENQEFAKLN